MILEQPESAAETVPAVCDSARRVDRSWGWIAAAVLAAALALVLYFRQAEEARVLRLEMLPPEGTSLSGFSGIATGADLPERGDDEKSLQ